VAVGHTADDQVETILMNLVRGAGPTGLAGMRATANYPLSWAEISDLEPSSGSAGVQLVRPLLEMRRDELVALLEEAGIAYLVDPSNTDPSFFRNRVRHELLPLMEELNPRVGQALRRTALILRDEQSLLESLVDAAWRRCATVYTDRVTIDIACWAALERALRRAVVRSALLQSAPEGSAATGTRDIGLEHVERVVTLLESDGAGARLDLPAGLRVARLPDALEIRRAGEEATSPGPLQPETELHDGETTFGRWRLHVRRRPRERADPVDAGRWTATIDAQTVAEGLFVRGRRAGDLMQPLGMAGRSKSLQDVFVDAKIPQSERDQWPVVVTRSHVVWIPGVRLDERVRLKPDTKEVVTLTAEPPR
jgi:tRNA(Ile)-lysidine synthase